MSKKISSLPLAKSLPSFLTPDAATPDVHSLLHLSDFKTGQTSLPSNLRRSRQVRGGAHFSYVTPLPTRFPYELREDDLPEPEPRKVSGQAVGDGTEATEAAAEQERTAKDEGPKQISVEDFLARLEPSLQHPVLSTSKLFTSPARKRQVGQAELVALSPSCIADILPDLDAKSEEGRAELTQMLSGHAVFSDEAAGFAPWSLCYGGVLCSKGYMD